MGRLLFVTRLAARDLRRRPAEAALLLLAIVAATATLTLGLLIHGVASDPYQNTRHATAGPDVVASAAPPSVAGEPFAEPAGRPADRAALEVLAGLPEVAAHSGPFPAAAATLDAGGQRVDVQAIGRDVAVAEVDQPRVTDGTWVADGEVVVEAALADALGVRVGDQVTVNGQAFGIAGIAVTAATPPYPIASACIVPCLFGDPPPGVEPPDGMLRDPGLIWLTTADARGVAESADALSYVTYLKLTNPADAQAFADTHMLDSLGAPLLVPWQQIVDQVTHLERNTERTLITGAWLLAALALASIAVLVGGRMADQIRRVGLLKAVGGTPALVATVLLAEYVGVALIASAAGLTAGWLAAPLLTDPTAGLIGGGVEPAMTVPIVASVTAVALAVAVVATCVPAVRAARMSTVSALADAARLPRRSARLIAVSSRLPASLLVASRIAARRPRRVVLGVVSMTVTASGIVAALAANAQLNAQRGGAAVDLQSDRLGRVLLVLTVMLIILAAVNTIFVTWATVLDVRHTSALLRALGVTPRQVSVGLSAAQVFPAAAGATLGIPGGLALYVAVDPDETLVPPLWQLLAVVPATVLVVAVFTAIPARIGAARPVAPTLRAERA